MPGLQEGLYLTRIPLKTVNPKIINPFRTEVHLVEFIPFSAIAWAMDYNLYNSNRVCSLLLLNTLEFRCYIQGIEFIKEKLFAYVGRKTKAGVEVPHFPWVV